VLYVYVKTEENGYIAWALLFTYLLCDDAMSIHERVGSIIASNFDFTPFFGLRLQDVGELAVTAISAVLLLTLIGFYYLRGLSMFQKISRDLLAMLLIIAFLGIVIDMVHIAVNPGWKLNLLFDMIEDGGEMIAMSVVAWYIFLLNIRKGHASFSLCSLVHAALTRRST